MPLRVRFSEGLGVSRQSAGLATVRSTVAVFEPCGAWLMLLKENMMDSYVKNSIVITRGNEVLFRQQANGDVLAYLDGFLVIPKEKVPNLEEFLLSLRVNADPTSLAV